HALPVAAMPIVEQLWRSAASVAKIESDVGRAELASFVDALASAGLLHARHARSVGPPPSLIAKAPRDLATRPFVHADALRRENTVTPLRRGTSARYSSASSGSRPVRTVVENSVETARSLVELLVQPAMTRRRRAQINRPANLALAPTRSGWPSSKSHDGDMKITPG